MSLPLGLFTVEPIVAEFLPPYDEPYTPLEEAVLGGLAIGDPSAGRQSQRWTVAYDGGAIKVSDESGAVGFTLTVAGVTSVSLGFDSNMQVTIAYTTAAGSNLYFFNSLTSSYQTMTITGSDSCRASVDDPRTLTSGRSDVIFAYTLGGTLYYRQQRDRYAIEYLIGTSQGLQLLRAGPTTLYRFQFKLGTYIPPSL